MAAPGSALAGFESYYPHQLSGGKCAKRVSLATTLIYGAERCSSWTSRSARSDVQTRNLMENELLDLWAETTQHGALHHARSRRKRSRSSDEVIRA